MKAYSQRNLKPTDIKPNEWYSKHNLLHKKLSKKESRTIFENYHNINLLSANQQKLYLGATLLNYAVRIDAINGNDLPKEVRFMNPLQFAENLEIPAQDLSQYKSKKKIELIRLIKRNKENDYGIDILILQKFHFPFVDHTQISFLPTNELIKKYRFSGKHTDYLEDIYKRFKPLVKYVAGKMIKHLPKQIELDYLISAGTKGLLDVIDSFSLQEGVKFETYAIPRIKGAILDELRILDNFPRSTRTNLSAIRKFADKFYRDNQREPNAEQIMAGCNLSYEAYADSAPLINNPESVHLDFDLDNGKSLSSIIEDPFETKPDSEVIGKNRKEILERALSLLSPSDQEFIVRYYYKDQTLKEIGRRFKYTESRASQVHDEIMEKLRKIADLQEIT